MEKSFLISLRLLIPGILVIVFSIPLFQKTLSLELITNNIELYKKAGIVAVLGCIYYIFGIQKLAFSKPLKRINDNIKNKLIQISGLKVDKCQADLLTSDESLMHVFYHFIDNDKSLTEKAKSVRLNGLIWRSLADVKILSILFSVIYMVHNWIFYTLQSMIAGVICIIIFTLVNYIFLPLTTKKHLSLSNEQIDFMAIYYGDDIKSKIKNEIARISKC
jgi:hypothetical protein